MTDFFVNRKDIRETRIEDSEPPELDDGQALLEVDSFGLTSNNVTYAVFGDAMSYWEFFPAAEGWGRVPVWGFADVSESQAEGLETGTRVYGYLPPSSHLVVTPAADPRGFVDRTEHRRGLPSAYQRYERTDADPFYREDAEDLQMLLRPLFSTSFLIDDMLADEGLAEGRTVVIGSASSKTALGVAHLLAARDDVDLVGLTSSRSMDFVEGLGVYGRTVTYDEVDSLGSGAGHLRGHVGGRQRAPGRPLPLRRRADLQHGGGDDPLGRDRRRGGRRPAGPAAAVLLRARPREEARRRTGAGRSSASGSSSAGTSSPPGRTAGWRSSVASASRRSTRRTGRCSTARWARTAPTWSRCGATARPPPRRAPLRSRRPARPAPARATR